MVELLPSILSADFARLADQIAAAERGGGTTIHVDVMDGHFVPNMTLGPPVVASLRKATSLPLDCHLMIDNPNDYIAAFAEAGANWVSVHYEACPHLHRTLELILHHGMKPGVVLNPATRVDLVTEVLPMVHHVLIMSVNPGFGGPGIHPIFAGQDPPAGSGSAASSDSNSKLKLTAVWLTTPLPPSSKPEQSCSSPAMPSSARVSRNATLVPCWLPRARPQKSRPRAGESKIQESVASYSPDGLGPPQSLRWHEPFVLQNRHSSLFWRSSLAELRPKRKIRAPLRTRIPPRIRTPLKVRKPLRTTTTSSTPGTKGRSRKRRTTSASTRSLACSRNSLTRNSTTRR